MGSALLNPETSDSTSPPRDMQSPGHAVDLRLQAAERLAAHRSRHTHARPRTAPEPAHPATGRSARIAAAVAERYANTQSYRAFLAAEAERAVQQARAAAEIAALNAQAVAAAQQSLLDTLDQAAIDHDPAGEDASELHTEPQHATEAAQPAAQNQPAAPQRTEPPQPRPVELSLWPDLDPTPARHASRQTTHHGSIPRESAARVARNAVEPHLSNPPLTVRLYEDASSAAHVDLAAARHAADLAHTNRVSERNDAEARALDEEIAFRQAPVFEEPAGPPMPLPANLIEFPRQLIASRKARPRLAEGPLREDAGAGPLDGQLRIFEVDPAQISTAPAAETEADAAEAAAPQWTSIWLDTPAVPAPALPEPQAASASVAPRTVPLPGIATIGRRTLAAAINAVIVFTAVLAFAAMYVAVAAHVLPWQPGPLQTLFARVSAGTGIQLSQLPIAVAITVGFLLLIYQALFFWLSTATPGMRCARIALCTFDDENPTRRAIRRRILAVLLSACPLGLGFLWAALDEDRLAWHDRLSRIYQRSY